MTWYIAPPSSATRFTLSVDTTGFVNPQFSILAVEAFASQVVGSFPFVDESAQPVCNRVHQEQIVSEQESVECVQQHTVGQIVHVTIPQIQEQIVESVQVIPRELFPEQIEEQILDIPVPPIVEEIAAVVQIIPQERLQQSTAEQNVVVLVPQVVEEQLAAEEITHTSVEIRTEVECVAPAPAASFAALDPAVLDGFQQALVGIGASDLDTPTQEQLDVAIKVILWCSKQFKILLENDQKICDLSKAKLGDLWRVQQAFARPHKAARR